MYIVHISSVHSAQDPRIRRKQLATIVDEGWSAGLVTGDLSGSGEDGVDVVRVRPGNQSRWFRMLITSPRSILKAACVQADVFHFHDPELLPWAWFLLLKKKPIIYDVHEDYQTSVSQKQYLPRCIRSPLGWMMARVEHALSSPFTRVIAERYYSERFPDATAVLNYPNVSLKPSFPAFSEGASNVLYTGNVSVDRGALNMARVAACAPYCKITTVGFTPGMVAESMNRLCPDRARLEMVGVDRYVPFEEIEATYRSGSLLAGIALFPATEHYRRKELTKFFEYMAMGLPVVASNFPVWRQLIEENGVGVCVDAENPEAVVEALQWLHDNPMSARRMSDNGRRCVREKYNWEHEAPKLVDLYQRLTVRGRLKKCPGDPG